MEDDSKRAIELIENSIYLIRGRKVMLDSDLAGLYGVETKVLNQAVKRNLDRFPGEFLFQLSKDEFEILRSQIVTSSWGGRRTYPFAFTEHGAVMLATVLNSQAAIQASIYVVKAFVQLREMAMTYKDLQQKIEGMEKKYDKQFKVVFDALKRLISPEVKKTKKIGFRGKKK